MCTPKAQAIPVAQATLKAIINGPIIWGCMKSISGITPKKVALLHLKKIWIELIHWDLALFGLCRYIPLANSTALAV